MALVETANVNINAPIQAHYRLSSRLECQLNDDLNSQAPLAC